MLSVGTSMVIDVSPQGWLHCGRARLRCALGRSGVRTDKREGDGATPSGRFPLRQVLYRPDRLARPVTALSCQPLAPTDGWCDDSRDPQYNKMVRLPYPARHERLWREDPLYDIIVVVGYNDAPVVPGQGSAIFVHIARPGYAPTEGCIALNRQDLLHVLECAEPATMLHVAAP